MQKFFFMIFLSLFWINPVSSAQSLKFSDIPKAMERFFTFHIDRKELSPTIVKRSIKLYLEQFDPEKVYLLESEVDRYIHMSDAKAQEILYRLKNRDYSDFLTLNRLMQESIFRAQTIRSLIAKELVFASVDPEPPSLVPYRSFAKTDAEVMQRQKNRMLRFYFYHKARTNLNSSDRKSRLYQLFEKKAHRIENNYLFLTNQETPMSDERVEYLLTLRILKAFAKSLDTHTNFFSPEEALEMRMTLEKQFEGVGVVLSEGIDGVMIAELIKGGPAEQSGQIQINDLLIEIDGISVENRSFEEVLEILKKKDKSEIILGFKRMKASNQSFYRVPLLKRAIVMNDERIQVSYERVEEGIVGKISLHSFYESHNGVTSEKDIKEAIRLFREKGPLVGLVLDLRENSGGFLSQAVKVAGLFVNNGVIVISKYGKRDVHYLRNIVSKAFYNGPLVILTSKMSASASEIVAGTLQDYGVALVVGDKRTFGKGSIQYQTVTDAKADMFFKVTVGKYYTVSGRSTQISGVEADIVIPSQYAPYKIGEAYLEYPLEKDQVRAAFIDPLADLDENTKKLFQLRYMPNLQREVTFWKKMLPVLKNQSAYRMAHDVSFQSFLKKQDAIYAKAEALPPNTIDEPFDFGREDLQMKEAVNIVKDMILIESQATFPKTGSD